MLLVPLLGGGCKPRSNFDQGMFKQVICHRWQYDQRHRLGQ